MAILNLGSADDDGNGDPLRDAGRKLNKLFGAALSRTDDVGAATATLGNLYIVPTSATGAWSGQDDDLAYYNGSAWEFYTPPEGFEIWVADDDERVRFDGSSWIIISKTPYDIRGGFSSTPTSSQVLDTIPIVRSVTFSADFAGSVGQIETNPTSDMEISVQDDAVEIGTITIASADGAFTFATDGGTAKVVAAGSILSFVAPSSADATAANAVWTILGLS